MLFEVSVAGRLPQFRVFVLAHTGNDQGISHPTLLYTFSHSTLKVPYNHLSFNVLIHSVHTAVVFLGYGSVLLELVYHSQGLLLLRFIFTTVLWLRGFQSRWT
jgi:hypothetical protein